MKALKDLNQPILNKLTIVPFLRQPPQINFATSAKPFSNSDIEGWALNLNRDLQGVWGGVKDWFKAIFSNHPELINYARKHHEIELFALLPQLFGDDLPSYLCLTDVAPEEEKVRSYPVDRAYRIINGLIDLLSIWHKKYNKPFCLVLEHFDHAGELSQRFFLELFRRRSKEFDLRFILRIHSKNVEMVQQAFLDQGYRSVVDKSVEIEADSKSVSITGDQFETMISAIDLRSYVFHDYARIIKAATIRQDFEAIFKYRLEALRQSNHFGYYDDALYHAQFLMQDKDLDKQDDMSRWRVYSYTAFCLLAQNRINEGFEIFTQLYKEFNEPVILVDICYQLAMFHTRYFKERDNIKAYDYIMEAKSYLRKTSKSTNEKLFHDVFLDNGMALIKVRMGKVDEAIKLCQGGFNKLKENLGEKEHLLHRSVLNYNTAQIFSRLNVLDKALEYFNIAINMDPNYSEYYNERGNLHQKMGHFDFALSDYKQALSCSAPYSELYFNYGVCLHKLGYINESVDALSKSLDYNVNQPDLLHYRAVIYEEVGEIEKAIQDYRRSIVQDFSADTLAHIAVLGYQIGDLEQSIQALNRAISFASDKPEYYYNRSVLYKDMGDFKSAAEDLKKYLALSDNPSDRSQVDEEIRLLINHAIKPASNPIEE